MLWALDFVMAIFGAVRGLMVMEVVIFMTVGLLDKLLTVRGLMVNLSAVEGPHRCLCRRSLPPLGWRWRCSW